MFDFYLLGLYGLFWQTIVLVAVAAVLLLISVRGASPLFQVGAVIAAVIIFAPLAWINWWVTSGDPEPLPDGGSNVGGNLHYASLAIIVALAVLYLAGARAWASRHPR